MKRVHWLGIVLSATAAIGLLSAFPKTTGIAAIQPPRQAPKYVVLGWNNLGMHCYDPDFSNLLILPPYNTLVAQVIKVGEPPRVVTSGVIVEYSFPDNTYSVNGPGVAPGRPDKSNFWTYAQKLFGLSDPLPPNVGLTGKGLSGTMDLAKDGGAYFVAEGIPLTNVLDRDAATGKSYPFQKALITVKDASKPSVVLAQLTVVAPVSTELMCANCHSDAGDATTGAMVPEHAVTPTGKVETNILAIHDKINGPITVDGVFSDNYTTYLSGTPQYSLLPLAEHQPVLCASCHNDNALGIHPNIAGVKDLSNAMHGNHNPNVAPDISPDTTGCYNCHPGPNTQCLRDTMSQNFSIGCVDCHGDITKVAQNPSPWNIEPKCGQTGCHGAGYGTTLPLYRESKGHGGVYCEGCHDSTHAIATSRETNDTTKFLQLQGHSGTLRDCTVCHLTNKPGMFKHME